MKKTVALTVAVIFVLAFAAPVFAQDMTHSTEYQMDGDIDLQKQVGHICNTGAEMKQVIDGEGEMTKVMDTSQEAGVITVDDQQDWVTAEDAVRNLTVTSAVELCAPAKSELGEVPEGDDFDNIADALEAHEGEVIPPELLYPALYGQARADLIGAGEGDLADLVDPLTDQIWAAQVEADPGYSGQLDQSFEAAFGPWADAHGYLGDDDNAWRFVDDEGDPVTIEMGGDVAGYLDDIDDIEIGDDYVGNYFNIDQFARTSQGTVQRYIDISSPWSGALVHEDMTVTGTAEIDESFAMDNLEPGEEATPDWWDLF